MKSRKAVFAIFACALVAACGSNQSASTAQTSRANAEMRCVEKGGFLVPSGKIFNCKLPSGRVVDVMRL